MTAGRPARASIPLPYLASGLAALALVVVAWVARDRFRPVAAGFPAPEFEALDASGDTVVLADFQGKVVLLNVWATWCGPCVEEMPSMQRLYDRFSRDDFEIAAVSVDAPVGRADGAGNAGGDPVAFARDLDLTFPVLLDPAGRIQRTYRTSGVPESFVIGADGTIYKKVAGATTWDSPGNVRLIERLAGVEASGAPGAGTRARP